MQFSREAFVCNGCIFTAVFTIRMNGQGTGKMQRAFFKWNAVKDADIFLLACNEKWQQEKCQPFGYIVGHGKAQHPIIRDSIRCHRYTAAFGPQIKYGVLADYGAKKEALQDLLLYWSSKEGKLISLKEYVAAMPEDQKYIYYANGESREALLQLPQMEKLQQKGYDVLFMTDEVDGFVPQTLAKYQDKELKAITAGDLGLETEEEKKAAEEKSEKSKQTLEFVKKTLGEQVKDVRLSDNLGSHPVSVVPDGGMTFEMEKYFKRMNPEAGMKADRILELNADHPIFAKLQIAVAQDEKKAEDLVKILYTQALLMAGLPVENAGEYTDLVCSLIG